MQNLLGIEELTSELTAEELHDPFHNTTQVRSLLKERIDFNELKEFVEVII